MAVDGIFRNVFSIVAVPVSFHGPWLRSLSKCAGDAVAVASTYGSLSVVWVCLDLVEGCPPPGVATNLCATLIVGDKRNNIELKLRQDEYSADGQLTFHFSRSEAREILWSMCKRVPRGNKICATGFKVCARHRDQGED